MNSSLGQIKNFLSSTASRMVLGPNQPRIQLVPWAVPALQFVAMVT
jgi:hypothetical protein